MAGRSTASLADPPTPRAGFPLSKVTGMFLRPRAPSTTRSRRPEAVLPLLPWRSNPADDVVGPRSGGRASVTGSTGAASGHDRRGATSSGRRGPIFHRVDLAGGVPQPATPRRGGGGEPRRPRLFVLSSTPGACPPTGPPGGAALGRSPPPVRRLRYWMVGSDGRVSAFGQARPPGRRQPPVSSRAVTPPTSNPPVPSRLLDRRRRRPGLHLGDRRQFGGVDGRRWPGEKVTGLSATRSGAGYWIFTTRGRVLPSATPASTATCRRWR